MMVRVAAFRSGCILLLALTIYPTSNLTLQNGVLSSPIAQVESLSDSIRTDFSDYVWPTDAGRIVTSVFAEYRSTHFHGGIDISTGDDTGYRVFASRDGYVARIIVGPTGYGKMLWLRHADGYSTTYAHLRNFNDAIDAFVKKEQLRLERYPVNIECKPRDFPVKKGDLIAYTGETGTGSPHLHFEIRDENKNFVNPLLCKQFTFPDDSLPRFFRLVVTPIGENSFINNSFQSHVIDIVPPLNGSVALPETLRAFGSFGFAVDVRDRINGSRFKSGVYSHRLYLDDSLIYSVQFDRAPSSDDFQVGLYYDFDLMSDEGGKIARLYMNSPNKLPFYQPRKPNGGIINTARFMDGIHKLKIISSDFGKHSSEVSGAIVFSTPSEFKFMASGTTLKFESVDRLPLSQLRFFTKAFSKRSKNHSDWTKLDVSLGQSGLHLTQISEPFDVLKIEATNKSGAVSFPQFYFPKKKALPNASAELKHEVGSDYVRMFLKTSGAFTSAPSITVIEGTTSRKLQPIPSDYNFYTATFRPLESFSGKRTVMAECEVNGRLQTISDEFIVYPILPKKPSQISVDGGKLQIIADSSSVYKPLFLEVQRSFEEESSHYSLLPRHTVMNRGLTVKMRANATQPQQAIFFRRSRWNLESTRREGDYLVEKLDRALGDIAVLTDVKPPFISRLAIPSQFKKQPHIISFRVRDNLSGVEYKELKLYIDDVFAIPEIDGERRRVVHRLAEPLKRGSHTLMIRLKDRVGNASEVRRTFRVR